MVKNKNTRNRKLRRAINKNRKDINKVKKSMNRKIKRIRNRNKNINLVNIKNVNKKFGINNTKNSLRIKGRDLVYTIPESDVDATNTNVLCVIPANPAYWTGTKIGCIACAYQNYRPIRFSVEYVPSCPATQGGNVIGGTFWDMTANRNNLQQSLETSNGGKTIHCAKNHKFNVDLKNNLQTRLYRTGGKFDQDSNPFLFVSISVNCINNLGNTIIPGHFYVNYDYELRNPLGDTIKYYNSGMMKVSDYNYDYVNATAIYCSKGTKRYNQFCTLQFDNGEYSYNDDPVNVTDDSYLWYFCNGNLVETVKIIQLDKEDVTLVSTTNVTLPSNTYCLVVYFTKLHVALIYNPLSNSGLTISGLITNDDDIVYLQIKEASIDLAIPYNTRKRYLADGLGAWYIRDQVRLVYSS